MDVLVNDVAGDASARLFGEGGALERSIGAVEGSEGRPVRSLARFLKGDKAETVAERVGAMNATQLQTFRTTYKRATSALRSEAEKAAVSARAPKSALAELQNETHSLEVALDRAYRSRRLELEQAAAMKLDPGGLASSLGARAARALPVVGNVAGEVIEAIGRQRVLSGPAVTADMRQVADKVSDLLDLETRLAAGVGAPRSGVSALIGAAFDHTATLVTKAARGFVYGAPAAATRGGLLMGERVMDEFVGDFPDATAAFESKARQIRLLNQDPSKAIDAIAADLHEFAVEQPKLYRELAAQELANLQYLSDHLPPSVIGSVVNPMGRPPAMAAIRQFAVIETAVRSPEVVLEAIEQGTVLPKQVKVLRERYPDTYEDVKTQVLEQIASNPASIPPKTRARIDVLFGTDGLAGASYSWRAAAFRLDSRAQVLPTGGGKALPISAGQVQRAQPQTPLGTAAARSGPTFSRSTP